MPKVVARMHRTMYQRLMAVGGGYDVWVIDAHALGAIAAAEDHKAAMVLFSTTIPSEFMQAQRVFKLQEAVANWPVILNTAEQFDPCVGQVLHMHGPYPSTFRFAGSVYNKEPAILGDPDVVKWLDDAFREGYAVTYVSLGTVKKLDIRDVDALMEVLSSRHVIWSLPEEHQQKLKTSVPRTFFVRKWLPQQAILNHPATKNFVSNCGMNSVQESLMAGVPIACVPQSGEQVAIAMRVSTHKVGSVHAPSHFNNTELAEQVNISIREFQKGLPEVDMNVQRVGGWFRNQGGVEMVANTIEETVRNRTSVFRVAELPASRVLNTASF